MTEVRITRNAGIDLEAIQARGLAEFGARATRDYMQGFDEIFARLGLYPLLGRAIPEYGREVRSVLHAPYRVLYRFEGGVVAVLRVLHSAQQALRIDDTQP